MLGRAQLLVEPGHRCFILCKLAFGEDHITIGDRPCLALFAHQIQILPINVHNVADGFELGADSGHLDRLHHRIARESQIRRVERVVLVIGQCRLLLDSATRTAEDVERVACGCSHL